MEPHLEKDASADEPVYQEWEEWAACLVRLEGHQSLLRTHSVTALGSKINKYFTTAMVLQIIF